MKPARFAPGTDRETGKTDHRSDVQLQENKAPARVCASDRSRAAGPLVLRPDNIRIGFSPSEPPGDRKRVTRSVCCRYIANSTELQRNDDMGRHL